LGQGNEVVAGITWDELRELAAFRSESGCAVSLYLNLDPSDSPTPAAVETRVNSQLSEAERLAEERRSSLPHDQREGLRADLERIRQWFDDGFDRDGVRGVAVFASSLDNFWRTVALPSGGVDDVKIAGELYLAPLTSLVGRDGALVAAVGRERGEVFRLRGVALVEIADETEEVPGRHDQGGWSQARYERHIENIVGQHLREVADTLDLFVRKLRGVPVVLVGAEDIRSEFEALLSKEVTDCLAGWASVEAHADAKQLLEAAQPVLEDWWRNRETALLDRWREAAATNGRAAAGWEATLEAASDGRVELLLVQNGVDRQVYQCPKCGRAQLTGGACPLDGTAMEPRENGVDVGVHLTLAHGGTVQVLRDRPDLEPVGGVAALLRF
jgi:peptide chain release factor subunit 1